jgi:hypothetical protein
MRNFISIAAAAFMSSFSTWLITERAATAQAHSAAVVADEEHGALRFMIDGREAAWLDASGFYVRGDMAYSGSLTDGLPAEVPHAP